MKVKLSILLFSVALILSSCGNKKPDQTGKTSGTVMQSSDTDYRMIIVAKLFIKPEKVKDFTEAAKEMIEKSNKETGCSSYQLYQDPYDNSKFVFVEEYKNQAAIETHFSTDYFKAFGPKISSFVSKPAELKIVSVAKEVNQ